MTVPRQAKAQTATTTPLRPPDLATFTSENVDAERKVKPTGTRLSGLAIAGKRAKAPCRCVCLQAALASLDADESLKAWYFIVVSSFRKETYFGSFIFFFLLENRIETENEQIPRIKPLRLSRILACLHTPMIYKLNV